MQWFQDRNDPVKTSNKTRGKKETQTDRKMIKTLRVYWKTKADIMGWWQKSITVVATRNWNKVGSSFPSRGTRTFMTFKSSHENKLLKSARQYGFVRYGYSFIWIGRYSTSLSSGHKNAYFCFWVCVMLYAP